MNNNKYKILIIEDEPSMRELIQRALLKERFVVETAATFFDAEDKIEIYDYDCILLDIMLPDGNGLKLLQRFKNLFIYLSISDVDQIPRKCHHIRI